MIHLKTICRLICVYGLCCLLIPVTQGQQTSVDASTYFFYERHIYQTSDAQICWLSLDAPDDETCVDVTTAQYYSVSPDGQYVAMQTYPDGKIHILNTDNQQITDLSVCKPDSSKLYDEVYHRTGNLLWSPDGQYLTFAGSTTGCEETDPDYTTVYLYDTASGELTDLAATTEATTVIPAAWSPDGEWLAIYGSWNRPVNDDSLPDLNLEWNIGFIRRDSTEFFRLNSNHDLCRPVWSPDGQWLSSSTACNENMGTGSAFVISPFSPNMLPDTDRRLDEVLSPLRFDWRDTTTWVSLYSQPVWISPNQVIAYRRITPMTFGYLSDERARELSSAGLVQLDIKTFSEIMQHDIPPNADVMKMADWYLMPHPDTDRIHAVNPRTDSQMVLPAGAVPCPLMWGIRLSAQGNYISVIEACDPQQPDMLMTLTVYSGDTSQTIAALQPIIIRPAESGEILRLVDFIAHTPDN